MPYYGRKHHLDRCREIIWQNPILFMKTHSKVRTEWNFLDVINIIYKKPAANIMLIIQY